MKNILKTFILFIAVSCFAFSADAQMNKSDLEIAFSSVSVKTHSHFNIVHNNNIDKFAMESDFSLEFKDNVMIIHNGLNEIHIAYVAVKYVSVGKPDKAHSEMKGQWFIMI